MTAWETHLDREQQRFVDELVAFVAIPSVSAKPDNIPDVKRAAAWVAARLTAAGAEHAQVLPAAGHPVVCADWLHAPGQPTGQARTNDCPRKCSRSRGGPLAGGVAPRLHWPVRRPPTPTARHDGITFRNPHSRTDSGTSRLRRPRAAGRPKGRS